MKTSKKMALSAATIMLATCLGASSAWAQCQENQGEAVQTQCETCEGCPEAAPEKLEVCFTMHYTAQGHLLNDENKPLVIPFPEEYFITHIDLVGDGFKLSTVNSAGEYPATEDYLRNNLPLGLKLMSGTVRFLPFYNKENLQRKLKGIKGQELLEARIVVELTRNHGGRG